MTDHLLWLMYTNIYIYMLAIASIITVWFVPFMGNWLTLFRNIFLVLPGDENQRGKGQCFQARFWTCPSVAAAYGYGKYLLQKDMKGPNRAFFFALHNPLFGGWPA